MHEQKNILIYGIGNDILTDDGIGPKIVEDLKNTLLYQNISYETGLKGGLEILEYIQNYDVVIFIDAIRTKNGIPGNVYLLTLDDFKETSHLSNIHDISFLEAIEMGKRMNLSLPINIYIIAIEIIEDKVFSESFSPSIQKAYKHIFNKVYKHIKDIYILIS